MCATRRGRDGVLVSRISIIHSVCGDEPTTVYVAHPSDGPEAVYTPHDGTRVYTQSEGCDGGHQMCSPY